MVPLDRADKDRENPVSETLTIGVVIGETDCGDQPTSECSQPSRLGSMFTPIQLQVPETTEEKRLSKQRRPGVCGNTIVTPALSHHVPHPGSKLRICSERTLQCILWVFL